MKLSWRVELPQLAVIAAMFAVAAWAWTQVGDRLPVHWNIHGEVDGWGNKFTGLLLMPIAVLGIYRQRVGEMLQGVVGRNAGGLRLALCIVAAFLPAAILGVLFDDRIEQYLFGVKPVMAAWVVGGIVILLLSRWVQARREGLDLSQLTWRAAILIGLAQSLAMWPGTSRSLITILGGLAVGLSLAAAVEFAFLLGVLTLTAATAYTALKNGGGMIEAYGWTAVLTGFFAAWISAALAVKWMVAWLNRHGLTLFAWWRFAAAALAAVLLL